MKKSIRIFLLFIIGTYFAVAMFNDGIAKVISRFTVERTTKAVAVQLEKYISDNDFTPTEDWLKQYAADLEKQGVVREADNLAIQYLQPANNNVYFGLWVTYQEPSKYGLLNWTTEREARKKSTTPQPVMVNYTGPNVVPVKQSFP